MDIRVRRLMLFLSVISFLIIAPFVVLYALGYRENIITSPTAVGVLLLDSIPGDATVTVNDRSYGTTPESIPNLTVGTVAVTVSKEGYHPWQKNLPIRPARATEARAIRLFLEDPPTQTISRDVGTFALAPNRTLLVWADAANALHVRSTENESLYAPLQLSGTPRELLWSPDSTYILIRFTGDRYQTVDIASDQLIARPLPTVTGFTDPSWDMRTPGRIFFRDPATDNLIRHSLRQSQQEILLSGITSYAVSDSQMYATNSQNQLIEASLDGEVRRRHDLNMEAQETITRLLVTPDDDIAALTNTQKLYHYADNRFTVIAPHALHAAWSPDASMLLVQSQTNELQVYNVNNERAFHLPSEQLHLVTRLSRPIQHPQWFAGGNHFIYQVDDAIVITETDTRHHPISHTADTTNLGDAFVTVGQEGQVLFYLKQQNGQINLVTTTLYDDE